MNSIARYEKIGSVVYGSVRLASALTASNEWLSRADASDIARAGAASSAEAGSLESLFFDKNPKFAHLKDEYFRILDAVRVLQALVPNLVNADESELDSYVSDSQRVHYALADVIEELAFSQELPNFLRLSVTPKEALNN